MQPVRWGQAPSPDRSSSIGFALVFSDADAARRIFERWRDRFGTKDVNDHISISVIRRLPGHPLSHYAVQITSSRPDDGEWEQGTLYQTMNRAHLIHPDHDANLERFIAMRDVDGAFILAPAVLTGGEADSMTDLAILKQKVSFATAADVGKHDREWVALELVARQDAE